jgi:hypothetical protein
MNITKDEIRWNESCWTNLKAVIQLNIDLDNALQSCQKHGNLPIISEGISAMTNDAKSLLKDAIIDMQWAMDNMTHSLNQHTKD